MQIGKLIPQDLESVSKFKMKSIFLLMSNFLLFSSFAFAEGKTVICGIEVSEVTDKLKGSMAELVIFYNKLGFDINSCSLGSRTVLVITNDEMSKAIIVEK